MSTMTYSWVDLAIPYGRHGPRAGGANHGPKWIRGMHLPETRAVYFPMDASDRMWHK
jgi:hypothetical protein